MKLSNKNKRSYSIQSQGRLRLGRGTFIVILSVLVSIWSGLARAEAYLSDFVVASSVDTYTFAPKDTQQKFDEDASEIWATAFLNQAPEGTLVEADWLYLREGQYQKILGSRMEAEGNRYFAAVIQPNEGGTLPTGEYRILYKLNGKQQGSVDFYVSASETNSESRQVVSTANRDEQQATCVSPQESAAEIEELVGGAQAQQLFGFGRYIDPEGRFSMIVPGAWFPADTGDPNAALFLSQNMENDPIAWFVVHVYNSHLTPKFTAGDTVNQLREMFIAEGANHGAEEIEQESSITEQLSDTVATGGLALFYETAETKQIIQFHQFVVDGQYGFNIQFTLEAGKTVGEFGAEDTGEMLAFIMGIASGTLWTEKLCQQDISR